MLEAKESIMLLTNENWVNFEKEYCMSLRLLSVKNIIFCKIALFKWMQEALFLL
jgi:hypothetical protein